MFTVQDRDRVSDRLQQMAREDARVVAGAVIGSLALGGGDRFSDVDLTFGLAEGVDVAEVLSDWTNALRREFDAAHLFDLPFQSTIYRVFLLPGNLQVDVSFTPGAEFGARGPRFRLLFGEAVERPPATPPSAERLFGWGVHHALRARVCVERGRLWQAEYWISELRDQTLALACLRGGLEVNYGRGFDDLDASFLSRFEGALVRSINGEELLRALSVAIDGLLRESDQAPALASEVEAQLRELTSPTWGGDGR